MVSNVLVVQCTASVALLLLGAQLLLAAEEKLALRNAQPAPAQVEIESKFIETSDTAILRLNASGKGVDFLRAALRDGSEETILSNAETSQLHTALSTAHGVDFLSAPKVTTRFLQRAVIEIVREFRYPTEWKRDEQGQLWLPTVFETRNCGVTFEVEPLVRADGAITLQVVPQLVEFLGFRDLDSGKAFPTRVANTVGLARLDMILKVPARTPQGAHRLQPVFSARKRETIVTLHKGEAILLASLPETEDVQPFKSPAESRRLIATISARVIDAIAKNAPPPKEESQARTERPNSSPAATATPAVATPASAQADSFVGSRGGDEGEVGGVKLCWCPPGRFLMGSPPNEPERRPGETQVEVKLSKGFWIGKDEVTQGQWRRVVGAFPGKFTAGEGDDLPVYTINFAEAEEFCRKLTEVARVSGDLPKEWEFRLPTEAQWEYACRAGTTTATSFGDKLSSKQANFQGKPYHGAEEGPSLKQTAKVGSYPANPWGLHDVHGNVFEWCRDWYHRNLPGGVDPDLYSATSTAARSGNGDVSRVRRGGCWADEGWPCRSAFRLRFEPERRHDHIGFRVVAVRP